MRALVIGGRDFNDLGKFQEVLNMYEGKLLEIVTHGYGNTDGMATMYAEANKIPIKYYPIENEDRESISNSNRSILELDIDIAFIFWDCKSEGTRDMLHKLLEDESASINVILIRY